MTCAPGTRIAEGEPLAVLHLSHDDAEAVARARGCFTLAEQPVPGADDIARRVLERITLD